MELRLCSTEAERHAFAQALGEARATRGVGFKETKASLMGEIHLAFGRPYAVFDENGPAPDQILGGFILHDLGSFGQSYPKPDLTHFPPETVFEFGELWSRAKGAGLVARRGVSILLGLFQAQAVVGYPILKPWDLTDIYKGFCRYVGEPVEWPYIETLEGGKILVQAMVSEGTPLRQLVGRAWAAGFQTFDHHRVIRFENPFPIQPTLSKAPAGAGDKQGQEANGAAPA